jgi:omega-6 fatty acid desaturase (delta-12 desaturase)
MVAALVWAALTYIPTIADSRYRFAAWMAYGFLQGLVCTGVWILGHECGHGAFSKNTKLNNVVGWFLHSFLMVPYFSWKYSHHRHHRYTGNIVKDMAFVPATQPRSHKNAILASLDELFEDTPIRQVICLISHQLLGWQVYTFLNASAGKGSKQYEPTGIWSWLRVSHFDPWSAVFRPNEALFIFISDIGLGITLSALYYASQFVGTSTVLYLYLVPYLWVHHWLGKLIRSDISSRVANNLCFSRHHLPAPPPRGGAPLHRGGLDLRQGCSRYHRPRLRFHWQAHLPRHH